MTKYIFDVETDGIDATRLHCLVDNHGNQLTTDEAIRAWCNDRVAAGDTLIGHNIIQYDIPTLERLLGVDMSSLPVIDTLAVSWYLFPKVNRHGLANWGEMLKIKKPEIEDWENLSIEQYLHRCAEDVRINARLWEVIKQRMAGLYSNDMGAIYRLYKHLTGKMQALHIQDVEGWRLDVTKARALAVELSTLLEEATDTLARVMPEVAIMTTYKRPLRPFKKDGTPSAAGKNWGERCTIAGVDKDTAQDVTVQTGSKEPNPNSSHQVKDWLFSLGWKPATFKFLRNEDGEERSIPQIKKDGELCPSIEALIDRAPAVEALRNKSVIAHRLAIVRGWLEVVDENGFIYAGAAGFTNTLRLRHRTIVNVPSVRVPWGADLRGCLIAKDPDNYVLLGSDVSSLENTTQAHYMAEYDIDLVKEMDAEGYDPHLNMAVMASLMSAEAANDYKAGNHSPELSKLRHVGKTANYACTYGAGAKTIARQCDIPETVAKRLHEAYHTINWSLQAISDSAETKMAGNTMWVYNPVAGFWYSLRAQKDAFSTLNQSTGAYLFDLWVEELIKVGARPIGQFHDEIILNVRKGREEAATKAVHAAMAKVNAVVELYKPLAVDVEIGNNYAEIH